ncbi:MAG: hypothetical protein V7699_01620 [Porticoccus sp.]
MREMFRQVFSAITTLFRTVERGANTLDNYASWAEQESADFVEVAAIERQNKIKQLEVKLKAA